MPSPARCDSSCSTCSRRRRAASRSSHARAANRRPTRRSTCRRCARLGEVERASRAYLGEDVDTIGRADLVERLARGDVVLVDVRPPEEYAAGHIEGARSIPLAELERRLAELPPDAEIVAYCRGPFCAYAHEAVRRLRADGRTARRLTEGWPEWRLAGQSKSRAA